MASPVPDTEEIAQIRRTLGDELADLCALADDYLARGPRYQAAVRAEVAKGVAEAFRSIGATFNPEGGPSDA